ncbi:hypothetical protein AB0J86_23605 [Micromonospora sp. NPDC049559]|uniref:sialidase family protein n=1 Tax=Micromonospora sp. NPDC049559 TaxID=3155923 RepID=UPI00344A75F6
MPELDVRLAQGRVDLLDRIDGPPLERLRRRAAARRRRRGLGVAVALLGVVAATALAGRVLGPDGARPAPAASPSADPAYSADGIVVHGLVGGANVWELPGAIGDVEFTDPRHGYLLTSCPGTDPCRRDTARTSDGGLTWTVHELPPDVARTAGGELLAFPAGPLMITGPTTYASLDGGGSWTAADPPPAGTAAGTAGPDDLLRPGDGGTAGCGAQVRLWRQGAVHDSGPVRQPPLGVCWVADAPATDGGWWVGGVRDGRAVVAVTRDGGGSWQSAVLETPPGALASVEVAQLGSHAYAAVLGPGGELYSLWHSADGGRTFARTRSAGAGGGGPAALAGALVPLLDGRLLVAGTDRRWYLSADDGRSFRRAEGTLPAVGRLARTRAGYVAYDLFGSGWVAFSADGTTWRKLQIS